MSDEDALEQALRRVLWLLRPYLGDLVVIGGWVPHLYRRYGGFAEWQSRLSRTAEVDVLVAGAITAKTRLPLATILTEAGFSSTEESLGAVWMNAPETGEKMEFFIPHTGLAKDIGRPRRLDSNSGIGAVALTDLELLGAHTRELRVPVSAADLPYEELVVRVPSLGAFVTAKASTFLKRAISATSDGRARRAKDIVYIRDIMAAGGEVVEHIEHDVAEIRNTGRQASLRLDYAASQLSTLNASSAILTEAASELAQRDQISLKEATADLRGYVTDLREILEG